MRCFQRFGFIATATLMLGGTFLLGSTHLPTAVAAAPFASEPPAQSCGGDAALRNLFKGAPAGMKVKDKVEIYDEKGLFNYIDGGAPLFINKHFRKLGAAEMASDQGGELTCDIYDMNGPGNAQAIFTAEKSPSSKTVVGWPEAISGPMSFVFYQGCYYVKLTAFDKKSERALPSLASALRDRMKTAAPSK